jgi:hypothetical protein
LAHDCGVLNCPRTREKHRTHRSLLAVHGIYRLRSIVKVRAYSGQTFTATVTVTEQPWWSVPVATGQGKLCRIALDHLERVKDIVLAILVGQPKVSSTRSTAAKPSIGHRRA